MIILYIWKNQNWSKPPTKYCLCIDISLYIFIYLYISLYIFIWYRGLNVCGTISLYKNSPYLLFRPLNLRLKNPESCFWFPERMSVWIIYVLFVLTWCCFSWNGRFSYWLGFPSRWFLCCFGQVWWSLGHPGFFGSRFTCFEVIHHAQPCSWRYGPCSLVQHISQS